MREKQEVQVAGRTVPLSNQDKVMFPAAGFTKAQVIDYYVRAWPFLRPHLKNRPVTLKRYPNGIEGKHFYEKDAPGFTPEWIETFPVPRRDGGPDIRYVVVNDLPTMVWCANLANLEIHPFLHRVPKLGQPTSLVFDLDPGEGVDILACGRVAMLLKTLFEKLKLEIFPKVSGSKGMQVYAPLNTAVTYEETQPFARAVAQLLEREHPDLVVSEMAKTARHNKVFIDWSQNSDFKTTVSVYSLRAKRPLPYVSMPVTWDELKRALKKSDPKMLEWQSGAALTRMEKSGDLFEPVSKLKQKLPSLTASERGAAYKSRD